MRQTLILDKLAIFVFTFVNRSAEENHSSQENANNFDNPQQICNHLYFYIYTFAFTTIFFRQQSHFLFQQINFTLRNKSIYNFEQRFQTTEDENIQSIFN
jgi:hypothetical protein